MILLDASALVKLVLEEKYSEFVEETVKRESEERELVFAPSIALPESINAIWKRCALMGELTESDYFETVKELVEIFETLEKVETSIVADYASRIALTFKLPIYDSLYLASSHTVGAPLLTFDTRLASVAEKSGIELVRIRVGK